MKRATSLAKQQYIVESQRKFQRTLNLKLQFDKLEDRFVENTFPLSLNIFDKLKLHTNALESDNNHLT